MLKFIPGLILCLVLPLCHAGDAKYVSMGKMLIGGVDVNPKMANGEPIPEVFYGTCVELIRGGAVLQAAGARVHALHPDLELQPCQIEAARIPNTRIIMIRADGPSPALVRAMLDAVMDEFIALRKQVKAGAGEGVRFAMMDECVRLEKEMPLLDQTIQAAEKNGKKSDELIEPKARLQKMKMIYDRLRDTLRKTNETPHASGEDLTIIERASIPALVKPGSLLEFFKK